MNEMPSPFPEGYNPHEEVEDMLKNPRPENYDQHQNNPNLAADQAHTEYQYAAGREGIKYGEEPTEDSFKESAAFLRELISLNPDWGSIDFSRVDVEHLNSLQDEKQRIDYAVGQLVDASLPAEQRSTMMDGLKNMLRRHKETLGKLTGATAALASLALAGGLVKEISDHEMAIHRTIESALDDGHLRIGPNIVLKPGMSRELAPFLQGHPDAVVSVQKLTGESDREVGAAAAEVTIQITEDGQTRTIKGQGAEEHLNYSNYLGPLVGRYSKAAETGMQNRVTTEALDQALDQAE